MKKLVAVVLVLVLTLGLTTMAFANSSGQNPNRNPGSPEMNVGGLTITVTGGGNNLQIRAILNADPTQSVVVPRTGNGTFNQQVAAFGYVYHIWVQGNSLVRSEFVSAPQPPVTPITVDVGFIGHYLHNGNVLTTSFFWITLNEGDTIDWSAVEAAYADWVARGGLAPDFTVGWQSSGFAPLFFAHGAEIGHGDFSFDQLEGFYRAYFLATGFVLPVVYNCAECQDAGCCACDCQCPPPYVCEHNCPVCCDELCVVCRPGCEDCEGNNVNNRCDGSGCAGNGTGAPGGNQGGGNQDVNQQ